ncbi:MAG: hybrid sensor histidine kinase/response regulator [Bacteroidetes bacterium GWD2_45_23]|nr:MAG: hybrid sensor histidine kinase/response regulator [Bacteroidetes bacterium GWC2_46_850]OFX85105.1 MAG: hybrid sensor histidine kinase/response regulator [Bacteroidetes bacterium GWD2_45_23]HBB00427.1 hybrid sensor histidine kinase/response regulator [Porphyromonadaceae bacterium]HCC18374.1 hybrid sensor histidine kinase/response regulator [Porphyromonadaceae bacterium]
MSRVSSILILICFFLSPLSAAGVNNMSRHNFHTLSTTEGLPTSEVQKVFQDAEGFLWFATRNGLCRYDGYGITVFRSDLPNTHHLTDNNIYCLADDGRGNLWVGTSNGVNRFDKARGEFEEIPIQNSTGKVVAAILITEEGRILIGLDDGLFVYDGGTGSFVHHTTLHMANSPINAPVKSIYEDQRKELWIGTWNSGLYRFDQKRNNIYAYPRLNPRNSAHVIYQDSKGRIWVGAWEGGLHLLENPYDPEHLSWKTYLHDASRPNSLSDNIVYDICEDPQSGNLWVGTRSGLSILNDADPENFINYSTFNDTNHLPNNEINSIVADNSGNIWIGSIGGGVIYTNTQKPKFEFFQVQLPEMPTAAIRSIYLNHHDQMWLSVGTYGIVFYDPESKVIVPQSEMPEFRALKQTTVYDIRSFNGDDLLFATYGDGLWHYRKGEPVKTYTTTNADFIRENRIRALYIDRNQNLWVGTQSGLGLRLSDGKGLTFDQLTVEGRELANATLLHITEDSEGRIWIATINHGLISVEGDPDKPDELVFRNYSRENDLVTSNTFNVLFLDSSNRLWAGAESGKLYLFDSVSDRFVDKSPRLPILGSMINSIQEDSLGNLWIGTNVGLARLFFDAENELAGYRVFSTADGLQDNFFIPNSSFNHMGRFYFGGYKGLACFSPSEINAEIVPTPFYITDIQILNTPFSSLTPEIARSVSKLVPAFTKEITIKHRHNNFSIHFASLNYTNPTLTRYAYKLNGFDREWRYSDAGHNMAHYNNLPAGNYTFLLRATNHHGIWNEEIKQLKVEVLPPYWLTWWAFLIYALLLLLTGYLIYRNITNRIHLRNQLRYSEMEQSKAEELNHAKLQFFTNITHEFLTPLTIISATVEEIQRAPSRDENLYATLTRNINRLTRLLQQILEFRKAESGNLQLRVSYGNISEFIRNSIDAFYPLIRKKKMHFSYLSNPEKIEGLFDLDKLDKILYNLLSNAAKYVGEGGSVQLTLSYDSDEKDHIRISVKDNGAGIAREDQQMLFSRFYEGDYRRHNTTGTGIGLSLVKDLVTLSHGTIEVISEPVKGSEFIVVLPIDISYFEESEIDFSEQNEIPDRFIDENEFYTDDERVVKKQTNIPSVLAVEDNEDILQLIQRLLSNDYQVYKAMNGKEALLVLEHEKIDIIVSDVMMPEIDGIELCKLLKNNIEYSHIPIILLTAKNEEKDRADAYESGADAFISKPFNLSVLHARIKNLLRNRERIARDFKSLLVFDMKEMHFTDLDEEFLQKAIDCVNRHLDDSEFDQQQFSEEMNVSKSTLYNKLKTLTGLHTSAFITNIRMKAACRIMDQNKNIRISELAYGVGYNDPKYFSSCFKKEFNMRPSEYIERFSGQAES